ncbi:WD repeat domain-containing protein [Tetrabaena socialis]|uniref:WD repeat domain-containing protein n=1 Tax=Tetrabaena socialis TaxID=47790 RepID=A0A2J8A1P7_9CHLO|nr:WD repeat domain-containing protein [Tetrabaena socialis]|eukprot:PNH06430.1 WD repeat domain-containing protein [Tetrabaena socialis]
MWNWAAGREAATRLGPHPSYVAVLAGSACGRYVAVGSGTTVTVWSRAEPASPAAAAAGGSRAETPAGSASAPWGAPWGAAAAVTAATELLPPYEPRAVVLSCAAEVMAVSYSPDGALLAAAAADGGVRVWETSSGRWRELAWLAGHGDAVCSLAFSPDARMMLSGGWDARCLAWSLRDVLPPRTTWAV